MMSYWYSLRVRYTASAVVLVMLIIAAALVSHRSVSQAQLDVGVGLQRHSSLGKHLRQLHVGLINSYTFIDAYLLDPYQQENRLAALASIRQTRQQAQQLLAQQSGLLDTERAQLREFVSRLSGLQTQTALLFEIRVDAARQFPSLGVGNQTMMPNRNAFNNSIAVALNEVREDGLKASSMKLYDELIQARYLWGQLLSNFRLYLANRIGSFNVDSLSIQENAIDTMYRELRVQLDVLARMDKAGKLGFQASDAVAVMRKSSVAWYAGFQQVKQIHKENNWRIDSKIMKHDIVPMVERLSRLLLGMEERIYDTTNEDVTAFADIAQRQKYMFSGSVLMVLLFLLLYYWMTNVLVFRPISYVVNAMHAHARGSSEVLPKVRSVETAALFDAFREMASRVQIRQEALEHQSLHDSLTMLPNRILLQERLAQQIQLSRRERKPLSLMIIDLDRFKEINDTLGHHVGDQVLLHVSERLQALVSEEDTVARLGGDEFAILLPDTACLDAAELSKTLQADMLQRFEISEMQLFINMSIGISCFPLHGEDVSTLIRTADVAMYAAKHGKQGYEIYQPGKDQNSLKKLEITSDLRAAIDNDQLELHYQPVIDLQQNKVVGFECLLRWEHPVYGWMPPEQVVEIAENTGQIHALTVWVIHRAMGFKTRLNDVDKSMKVAINLSVFCLRSPSFVSGVREIFRQSSIDARDICFEITESAMMSNPHLATRMLQELDGMGMCLAIDDFGTGFSSLAYLKQLPVTSMKIDKSFVMGMAANSSDDVIVRSTIELAHNLGMQVIAEGVEDVTVYRSLQAYGCDMAQGYYMSRPLNAERLFKWLADHYPFYRPH